jgi:hypothetical protein
MKPVNRWSGIAYRLIVAGILAVLASVLSVLESVPPEGVRSGLPPAKEAAIEGVVDTLFARYGITGRDVRSWRILARDKRPLRMEQRILVGRDFPSLWFNYELQTMLSPLGAGVIATERSKDNIVTMHIVRQGRTIRSMAFHLGAKVETPPALSAHSFGGKSKND